jgi:Ca2+-binding RTX toxin-like protein
MGVITLERVRQLKAYVESYGLNAGVRFSTYRELYNATGLDAFRLEADVSSLQSGIGVAAGYGNLVAIALNENYDVNLDEFSQNILLSGLTIVEKSLLDGTFSSLTNSMIFDATLGVWKGYGVYPDFPGRLPMAAVLAWNEEYDLALELVDESFFNYEVLKRGTLYGGIAGLLTVETYAISSVGFDPVGINPDDLPYLDDYSGGLIPNANIGPFQYRFDFDFWGRAFRDLWSDSTSSSTAASMLSNSFASIGETYSTNIYDVNGVAVSINPNYLANAVAMGTVWDQAFANYTASLGKNPTVRSHAGDLLGTPNIGMDIKNKVSQLDAAEAAATLRDLEKIRERLQYTDPRLTAKLDKIARDIKEQQAKQASSVSGSSANNGAEHYSDARDGGYSGESGEGGEACFTGETLIALANGTNRPISQIAMGDRVLCFDAAGDLHTGTVTRTFRHENVEVLDGDGWGVTANHPFLTSTGDFRPFSEIAGSEQLVTQDCRPIRKPRMTRRSALATTFNITVEPHHTYIAAGYRVHNKVPVVLDLDGDGIELIPRAFSGVSYDVDADGYKERTSWVAPDDGLLVIDLDGDGKFDSSGELAFAAATPEHDTDLEALEALYDSYKDARLTKDDADWSRFRIWQDFDSDGTTDDGELRTLDDLGITEISLSSDEQQVEILGVTIYGTAGYAKSDGNGGTTIGKVGDLAFDADSLGYKITELANGVRIDLESGSAIFAGKGDSEIVLELKSSGFDAAIGGSGNDDLKSGEVGSEQVGASGVGISGAGGNDTLTGGDGNDRIVGGDGQDKIDGGEGDDLLFVDSDDTLIQGGGGTDRAIVSTNSAFTVDLALAGLEIVQGGRGDDLLDGSHVAPFDAGFGELQGVTLNGDSGDDTLLGSDGADTLTGGIGHNIIMAGKGGDTIVASGSDEVDAGEGFDRIVFTDSVGLTRNADDLNAELISGGSGDDHFSTSDLHRVGLYGDLGDDFLEGSRGSDELSGEAGDDVVAGGAGNDVYRFSFDEGQDEITDADNYWIQLTAPTEEDHNVSGSYTYTTYVWVDGSDPDGENGHYSQTTKAKEVTVTVRNYDLVTQPERVHVDGGKDVVEFGAGITKNDLVFEFRGMDLYVGLRNASNPNAKASALDDAIRLVNWLDPLDRVETFKFADGSTSEVASLVGTGLPPVLSQLNGTKSSDILTGGSVGDHLVGEDGNDTIAGETGDDRLEGGKGNDTYVFGRGDAWDVIRDESRTLETTVKYETRDDAYTVTDYYEYTDSVGNTSTKSKTVTLYDKSTRILTTQEWKVEDGGSDTLSFASGIKIEDVAVKVRGNDLLIVLRDSSNPSASFWELSDRLRIENWADSKNRIEKFELEDAAGNRITIDVSSMIAGYTGGETDEVVTGDEATNWLAGSGGNDVMLGLQGNDVVIGGAGDDVIAGGSGADWILGGDGKDSADYADSVQAVTVNLTTGLGSGGDAQGDKISSIENVIGSRSNDSITGDAADNIVYGGDGNDKIDGAGGNDTACYSDSIFGVTVDLANNVNNKGGYAEGDELTSIENLIGSSFDDKLSGHVGDNQLEGGLGKDTLVGGAGSDTAIYEHSSAGVTVALGKDGGGDPITGQAADAEGDILTEIENILGSAFADTLTGDANANKLEGSKGDDVLQGAAGADTLDGGEGIDTASYAAASAGVTVDLADKSKNAGTDAAGDELIGIENLTGSDHDDDLTGDSKDNVLQGGKGADKLTGGDGIDTATYAGSEAAVTVSLATGAGSDGDAAGDTLSGIENLTGSKGNDTLTGDGNANRLTGGEGLDVLDGGAGDDTLDAGLGNDIIIGGLGADTVSYVGALAGVKLDLSVLDGSGYASASGGSAADKVKEVESIIGGIFADELTGDAAENRIEGGSGNDTLDGGLGADSLVGGFGRDVYRVDNVNEKIVEEGIFDIDRVESSVTWTLGANLENLTLTGTTAVDGTGNELDNALIGNVAGNLLVGGKGADTLDGGAGADTLKGGEGDDRYVVDDAGDTIVEATNPPANAGDPAVQQGTDSVEASVDHTLSANVEYLYLIGAKAISGTGNAMDNIIVGNAAENTLSGAAGNDTLVGGLGADAIDGGDGTDLATYAASEEGVTVDLATGTGSGGTAAGDTFTKVENVIGSDHNDTLTGSDDADNRLDGGKGRDVMAGGKGNDTYVIDTLVLKDGSVDAEKTDSISEDADEGTDTVESSVDWTLGANFENLTLTGFANLKATGNASDNILIGNDGDNVIDGQAGADTMKGGRGDDIYKVDSLNDSVSEEDAENEYWGKDRVESAVSFTLGKNLEDMTLTGAGDLVGIGNELYNKIIGTDGINELRGLAGDDFLKGGKGGDFLDGGDGNDTVSYEGSSLAVTVNLETGLAAGGDAEGDHVAGFEHVVGSDNADAITGTDADNRLDGGKGGDVLTSGKGDDVYVVDDTADLVVEKAGEGYDRIEASTSYTAPSNVEEIALTGVSDINATGNSLDNKLYGNSGANRLNGGSGKDTMTGGLGNDTYVVDGAGDVVNEYQGGGIDTVESAIAYALSQNLENLKLTGSAAIDGTGTGLDNELTGNSGANKLSGLAGNDKLAGGAGADTMDGGEGIDTVDYSASATAVTVNLADGAAEAGGDAAGDTLIGIENLTGSKGNDTLTGSDAENRIDGGEGADKMTGGLGSDTYVVDNTGDAITELANAGRDTVELAETFSGASYTLGSDVENLVITGKANINGTGNSLENILIGNDGDNKLDGSTGADILAGGFGNDVYVVDSTADRITELADRGTDRVEAAVDWTLGAELEDLTLTGTAALGTGNSLANKVLGNASANTLKGEAGNDTIEGGAGGDTLEGGDGTDTLSYGASASGVTVNVATGSATGGDAAGDSFKEFENLTGSGQIDSLTGDDKDNRLDGGAGADALAGGKGNDAYVVDNAADAVTEQADEGTDVVEASVTIAALAANVENLVLTGTGNIDGRGNALGNVITGNSGTNKLEGGDGNDTLEGGAGADTLYGGTSAADSGDDTVSYASSSAGVTVDLSNNANNQGGDAGTVGSHDTLSGIENLVGSVFSDKLTGDLNANRLDGGRGADTLTGGAGNDAYVVDNAGDSVTEGAGAGTDTVEASVEYKLTDHVENLSLTGTANIGGTGNTLANVISGNDGNNRLDGGVGADTLKGGKGNDIYVVDSGGDSVEEDADTGDTKFGVDTIEASISFSVATNGANVENLTLTGSAMTGTGNDLGNVITGNDVDNTLVGGKGDDTLIGGKGNDSLQGGDGADTALYENAETGVTADLDTIGNNKGDAAGDSYDQIENLTGSAANDTLRGNSGDNRLDGGKGVDTLEGGAGNDTYVVDSKSDAISDTSGTDTVEATISFSLKDHTAIENLRLLGNLDLSGTGNSGNNVLYGNDGNNALDGDAGSDTLRGGKGHDVYYVDSAGDAVSEYTYGADGQEVLTVDVPETAEDESGKHIDAGGIDTVAASVDYELGEFVENLSLTGSAGKGTGNVLNNVLLGNAGANTLSGGSGHDRLVGGEGVDQLDGGDGNDTLVIDASDTAVIGGAGIDTVEIATSYALGSDLENLILTGNATTGTGNASDNRIIGNATTNTLSGGEGNDYLDGGKGNDSLLGGKGDDTYGVDSAGDVITEATGEGTDKVLSSVSYVLGANIETLILTGESAIDGTGNSDANEITGNKAGNRLDGAAGADTLTGGQGSDIYVVDNAGDKIVENKDEGVDKIEASISFKLASDLENLSLTGSGNLTGEGNELDNEIIGNTGNNLLDGYEGNDRLIGNAGADTLRGGKGDDVYVVANGSGSIVENANEGIDRVESSATFTLSAEIEDLRLVGSVDINGTGNDLGNKLTGNTGKNVLLGGKGDDLLDGNAGADTLLGAEGSDTYVVDDAGDITTDLTTDAGFDVVYASVSHAIGAGIEAIALVGKGNIDATGNELANVLIGNEGNNRLNGGNGIDRMAGGLGDDTYVVDDAADVVQEGWDSGIDTVIASASYTLSFNVENLTLAGSAIKGTGNAGNNTLIGNATDNTLTGDFGDDFIEGGDGADKIDGGFGIDTASYRNSDAAVTVNLNTAAASGGHATGDTLTFIDNLEGSAFNDSLTGDDYDNRLNGGQGADTLSGGAGKDTLVVDDSGDLAYGGTGTDLVESSVTHDLYTDVENLTLTGKEAIDGIGNTLANLITGNEAANKLDGGTGNDTLVGGSGADNLIGNAGTDVASYATAKEGVVADLTNTANNTGDAKGDVYTQVEGLAGSGFEDDLRGDAADNRIDGGGSADKMSGGAGNDTYVVDHTGDRIVEAAGNGTDVIETSVSYVMASNADQVENLTMTGTFAGFAIGNALNNKLTGNDGDNRLDGGTGTDTLVGGEGNDTYAVDVAGDVVTELANEGNDTVESSITYDLTSLAYIENVTLTGTASKATGNASNNVLTGNGSANTLIGAGGNDILMGGLGADSLDGGTGTDTASYANATDKVTADLKTKSNNVGDAAGDSYTLIENLVGSRFNDTLTGDDVANRLDGGLGVDTLSGGLGNDVYVVDDANDKVSEAASAGTDTIEASVSFTIADNVENLILTGSTDLNGTGNTLANKITGNDGNNKLDGGTGADTLVGGAGDDTYYVDQAGDTVTEVADEGTDTIVTAVAYDMVNDTNVENLTMTGAANGDLRGNAGNNVVTGNNGNNKVDGYSGVNTLIGGLGNDTIYGASGTDTASYAYVTAGGVTANLTAGTANAGVNDSDTLTSIEHLLGSNFNDTLTGGTTANRLDGGKGNDTIDGQGGNDTLVGGEGDDKMTGGAGADRLDGGEGSDWADYVLSAAAVTVNLAENTATGGDAAGDRYTSVENIRGSALADTLTGDSADNILNGHGGADTLNGGDGLDSASYADSNAGVTVNLTTKTAAGGHAAGDVLNSIEGLIGSIHADVLTGNDEANRLDGGGGADSLTGGKGDDTYVIDNTLDSITENASEGLDSVEASVSLDLTTKGGNIENLTLTGSGIINGTGNSSDNEIVGNGSANVLSGLGGNDDLDGGAGNDTLTGGEGSDTFRFARNGGQDLLNAADTDGGADKLVIGGDVDYDQLWFQRIGNDLAIDIVGASDRITVQGWYSSEANQLDRIELSSGDYISANEVDLLRAAMATIAPPVAGQLNLNPQVKQVLAPTLAASWHSAA